MPCGMIESSVRLSCRAALTAVRSAASRRYADASDQRRKWTRSPADVSTIVRSIHGELVAPAADVEPEDDLDDDVAVADDEDEADEDGDEVTPVEIEIAAWAGESDLLEDLGVTGRTLRGWVEGTPDDPGTVLAQVGETAGFADLLAALR